MTGLFQTLIDFLSLLLHPIYSVLATVVNYISGLLIGLILDFFSLLCIILTSLCYVACWVFDKVLILAVVCFKTLFGTTGIFAYFNGIGASGNIALFVQRLLGWGAYGVGWVQNFIDINAVIPPVVYYLGFVLIWAGYKVFKSWIPTIGA